MFANCSSDLPGLDQEMPNETLRRAAIPLRSTAAGERKRYRAGSRSGRRRAWLGQGSLGHRVGEWELRVEQTKRCAWGGIGANERGGNRFPAIEDGVRQSTQSRLLGKVGTRVRPFL